jgi:2-methylcitrate dehydratase PrpD
MNAPTKRIDQAADATRALVRFATGLRYENLAEDERRHVRRHVLDTIGAALAGSNQNVCRIICETFKASGLSGSSVVPGTTSSFDPLSAVYAMATAAHGLEVDDGYRAGSVHPGAVVVPTALIFAANEGCDGPTFMVAVAAGYEASTRIAEAVHPQSRQRGFHNTSVVGPLAAALTLGVLHGQSGDTLEQALGIAASSSAGLFAFLHGGGEVKRAHAGHAAREGALAALLAERGLTGPVGVLTERDGLFQAFSSPDQAAVRFKISQRPDLLAVTHCYMKPYACCRHLHPAIDAVRQIVSDHKLSLSDVSAVDIGTYAIAAEHAHTGWGDMASAQMSFPFCIGVALAGRSLDMADFGDAARKDDATLSGARKVRVTVDQTCEANYPAARSALVKISTTSGRTFEQLVDDPYGSSTNPLDDAAVTMKFMRLASPVLGAARAREAAQAIGKLDGVVHMGDIAALLTPN